MINIHEERLKQKLALWDIPGFFNFINDLQAIMSETDIMSQVQGLKRKYKEELKEIQPKGKFKQGRLL